NMSDGTLRVLGVLLAVLQPGRHSLIAIEEPEATVHPAVSEVLVEVLLDAAHELHVLVTIHSLDILDHKAIEDHQIRAVVHEDGESFIARLSPSSRDSIRERLYTPGELLRHGELMPDPDDRPTPSQLEMFAKASIDADPQ